MMRLTHKMLGFAVAGLAIVSCVSLYIRLSRDGKATIIKVVLQNTLIDCRESCGDTLCDDSKVSWRTQLQIRDWMNHRNTNVPSDPYEMPNRFGSTSHNASVDMNFGNVFAVKYHTPPSLTKSEAGVPLFVYIEGVMIPAFSNVDFNPYDLREYVRRGFHVTAIDANKRVWKLTLDDCNITIAKYIKNRSGGTPE